MLTSLASSTYLFFVPSFILAQLFDQVICFITMEQVAVVILRRLCGADVVQMSSISLVVLDYSCLFIGFIYHYQE